MKDNKRLTIGFIIHRLDNDYAKLLLKGALYAAEELNANLAVFPGRSLDSQLDNIKYTAYEYQNNVIYSYASKDSLDALVISAGTVGSFVSDGTMKEFIDSFDGLPVVTTENKIGEYPCVRMSGSGIKDIINHLIKHHGKRNIAFVSGPKSNADAEERLNYYKEALEENCIAFDPSLVAYGKFSEYCSDLVGELLDENKGRIDALCFANDMMCKGGYKAIEERGLVIGKDIAVTGYDDSEVASGLKPMLTTVRADASLVGYNAVYEAVKLVTDGVCSDLNLNSYPIYRQSCGCEILPESSHDISSAEIKVGIIASKIIDEYIYNSTLGQKMSSIVKNIRQYITTLLNYAVSKEETYEAEDECKRIIEELTDIQTFDYVHADTLVSILNAAKDYAVSLSGGNKDKIIKIQEIINYALSETADRVLNKHYAKVDDLTFTHFLINNITKDMTIHGSNEEKCYFSIVNNLYRIHMASSYIYTYANPIVHTAAMKWTLPENIYLKSYHNGDKLAAITGEAQIMPCSQYFYNFFTPDRRRTAVISPLFLNEEQYGIIVSELEFDYFPYIYSIIPQICAAIKLTKLVGQLERSLDAEQYRNSLLNRISMSDELTGIYNRRGFYEFANNLLKAPENEGKRAALIFGDLDNLKKINDTFGHDEGDYAIKTAASFMKSCFRQTDVVARIGGDEFAAFAVCEDRNIIASIPRRIKNMAALNNIRSTKPYNVTISVGLFELICSSDKDVQSYMDKADTALYADKKNKNQSIMKA
mgnify:FL=1